MGLSARRARIVGRLRSRKTREREGAFLVEGVRAVAEALDAGADLRFVVASPRARATAGGDALLRGLGEAGVEVHDVDDDALAELADTETPQGVLAVCAEPAWSPADLDLSKGLLVLDRVQDPGNLGTLVRAATAFGLGGVLALEGTVDPWNPKAVRASAGAAFRMRVAVTPWSEAAPCLEAGGVSLWVADADGTDVARVRPEAPWALVVGNEGRGVRPSVRAGAAGLVAVPMPGGAESLNAGVAGAVLLYALTAGRGENA